MKQLKEQTVYIPTKNKSEFGVIDPTFGESDAYVKTCYCLSKDELIELLSDFYLFATNGEVCNHVTILNFFEPDL